MRLKKHFYACICMLLIGIGSLQAKEVTLTEAGTLSGMISNEELNSLTELTVNGPVNGSDIKIIRAMGRYAENTEYEKRSNSGRRRQLLPDR